MFHSIEGPDDARPAKRLRIGLMGTRGIPASYGGFETFYEQLAPRLAARGHHVAVYNRAHVTGHSELREYRGVRLHHVPSVRTKHLDTISHSTLSVLHGALQRFNVVYVCGVGNTPVAWVPRLFGAAVVLNVDSADWKRTKWGPAASRYLRAVERASALVADVVVADNPVIRDRYRVDYGIDAIYVPYGATFTAEPSTETLDALGLSADRYVLWVGRLEPETRVEELIEAFRAAGLEGMRLVVVGDAPFARAYRDTLHMLGGDDVVFTGYQFGAAYRSLTTHAFAYVQTSPTSGTSPALLEQMAAGNAVVVRGTDTNRAVILDAGLSYDPEDPIEGLAACLRTLAADPLARAALQARARARAATDYDWDVITDRYEALFGRLAHRRRTRRRGRASG
jgi:glycosyltransferase involved in cell wall biosynthesis